MTDYRNGKQLFMINRLLSQSKKLRVVEGEFRKSEWITFADLPEDQGYRNHVVGYVLFLDNKPIAALPHDWKKHGKITFWESDYAEPGFC